MCHKYDFWMWVHFVVMIVWCFLGIYDYYYGKPYWFFDGVGCTISGMTFCYMLMNKR